MSQKQFRNSVKVVTLFDTTTETAEIELKFDEQLVGVQIPGTYGGSNISILASADGEQFVTATDINGELKFNVSPPALITFDAKKLLALERIKLKSDANQSGDIDLKVITRPID